MKVCKALLSTIYILIVLFILDSGVCAYAADSESPTCRTDAVEVTYAGQSAMKGFDTKDWALGGSITVIVVIAAGLIISWIILKKDTKWKGADGLSPTYQEFVRRLRSTPSIRDVQIVDFIRSISALFSSSALSGFSITELVNLYTLIGSLPYKEDSTSRTYSYFLKGLSGTMNVRSSRAYLKCYESIRQKVERKERIRSLRGIVFCPVMAGFFLICAGFARPAGLLTMLFLLFAGLMIAGTFLLGKDLSKKGAAEKLAKAEVGLAMYDGVRHLALLDTTDTIRGRLLKVEEAPEELRDSGDRLRWEAWLLNHHHCSIDYSSDPIPPGFFQNSGKNKVGVLRDSAFHKAICVASIWEGGTRPVITGAILDITTGSGCASLTINLHLARDAQGKVQQYLTVSLYGTETATMFNLQAQDHEIAKLAAQLLKEAARESSEMELCDDPEPPQDGCPVGYFINCDGIHVRKLSHEGQEGETSPLDETVRALLERPLVANTLQRDGGRFSNPQPEASEQEKKTIPDEQKEENGIGIDRIPETLRSHLPDPEKIVIQEIHMTEPLYVQYRGMDPGYKDEKEVFRKSWHPFLLQFPSGVQAVESLEKLIRSAKFQVSETALRVQLEDAFYLETRDYIWYSMYYWESYHDGGGSADEEWILTPAPEEPLPESLLNGEEYNGIPLPQNNGFWLRDKYCFLMDPFGIPGCFSFWKTYSHKEFYSSPEFEGELGFRDPDLKIEEKWL